MYYITQTDLKSGLMPHSALLLFADFLTAILIYRCKRKKTKAQYSQPFPSSFFASLMELSMKIKPCSTKCFLVRLKYFVNGTRIMRTNRKLVIFMQKGPLKQYVALPPPCDISHSNLTILNTF